MNVAVILLAVAVVSAPILNNVVLSICVTVAPAGIPAPATPIPTANSLVLVIWIILGLAPKVASPPAVWSVSTVSSAKVSVKLASVNLNILFSTNKRGLHIELPQPISLNSEDHEPPLAVPSNNFNSPYLSHKAYISLSIAFKTPDETHTVTWKPPANPAVPEVKIKWKPP